MAGGNWKSQDKVRPGAYLRFTGAPKFSGKLGDRGIVTLPLSLDWGTGLIEITPQEFLAGDGLKKLGLLLGEAGAKTLWNALQHCPKALVYRINGAGAKATKTLGSLVVAAKHTGKFGNEITVKVVAVTGAPGTFTVHVFVKGSEVEVFEAKTVEGLGASEWVDFSGAGALTAQALTPLVGGQTGAVDPALFPKYFEAVRDRRWNTMGIPSDNATLRTGAIALVTALRESEGVKVQVVVPKSDAGNGDYEGVIVVSQGYKVGAEEFTVNDLIAYVAGLTAGTSVTGSNTYHVIDGAVEIVNPEGYAGPEKELLAGRLCLSRRRDGKIVIEQDINSFKSFTPTKGYAWSKNRVVRTMDEIHNGILDLFEQTFLGKVDNTDKGRDIFKGAIVDFLTEMNTIGAIQGFNGASDVTLAPGKDIDAFVGTIGVQPVDSMEKMYMTIVLR